MHDHHCPRRAARCGDVGKAIPAHSALTVRLRRATVLCALCEVMSRSTFSSVASSRASSPTMRPSAITRTRSDRPRISTNSDEITRTAMPSSASVADQRVDLLLRPDVDAAGRLVEDRAPSVSTASHLASTTFCWLPPESEPATALPSCRVRMSNSVDRLGSEALLGRARRSGRRGESSSRTFNDTFHRTLLSSAEPLDLAILGEQRDAGLHRVRRVGGTRPAATPSTAISPRAGTAPNNPLASRRAPCAVEPDDARRSRPPLTSNDTGAASPPTWRSCTSRRGEPGGPAATREHLRHLATDHHRDQVVAADVGDRDPCPTPGRP